MKTIFLIAGVVTSSVVVYGWYAAQPGDSPMMSPSTGAAATSLNASAISAEPSFALPEASLYATESSQLHPVRQAVFELQPNGELHVDAMTAARLELLFSESPDLPDSVPLRNLKTFEDKVKEGMPARAHAEVVRILHAYSAFRNAEAALMESSNGTEIISPDKMLEQIAALRRQHLGEHLTNAMFAAQEAKERFDVQVARIEADAILGTSEKIMRIEALRKTLPAELASESKDSDQEVTHVLEKQVADLRQRGAAETEVWKLRQKTLSPEDAQALNQMDIQKLDWENRYQQFALQKEKALSIPAGTDQHQAMIETLLRQHYTEQELGTARAYARSMSR